MTNYLYILVLVFCCNICKGQRNDAFLGGTEHIGLGGATVSLQFSGAVMQNPAGIYNIGAGIGAHWTRRYNITGLEHYNFSAHISDHNQGAGLHLSHFDFAGFRAQSVNAVYGRKLLDGLSLGTRFAYTSVQQEEFGNTGAISFDLGLQALISDKVLIGLLLVNPLEISVLDDQDAYTSIRFGGSYTVSDDLFLVVEIEKDLERNPFIKAGVNYVIDQFQLSMGVIPSGSEVSLGIAFVSGDFRLLSAFSYDQRIDISPSIGFEYLKK